ncbi:MAG: sigma-70 family RNA polymerase sigma factor [Sedimentisphaerales bacterium]|nr:sigma-70 family RNA polymerase sigma factor [Sedimentisphaerales bacterium]
MLEDKLLILRFNRGSREALQAIYENYKDDLVTLAAALLIDVNLAEDVVHDVFVSFIESAQRFQLTGSLKGYLATCVANNARNKIKANKIRNTTSLDEADSTGFLQNPENRAIFGEELRQLTWALGQLPFEQREVLILHSYSDLNFRTIAAQQKVSINTIQGRYRYAMDKLRSLLNSEVKKCDLQKK